MYVQAFDKGKQGKYLAEWNSTLHMRSNMLFRTLDNIQIEYS